ncbi:MAG: hypothetical protein NTU45_00080 [Planctomycetota bacterium]|nr:hypothetical protein [Planctomycetota bacterium]
MTHALDEMRVHLYDPSWRLLESRIDTDFDPNETSPDFEEYTQLVWGLRYIDDIVSTRRDLNPAEEDGAEVRMFHATDAQFSSVAVLLDNGSLLERVAYSPYGVARHQWPADSHPTARSRAAPTGARPTSTATAAWTRPISRR